MKHLLAFLLLLVLILCSCSIKDRQTGTLPALSEELSTLRRQVEYYEARTTELESELRDAKVELYMQQIDYENRLRALESAVTVMPKEEEASALPSIVWFYEENGDGATITGVSAMGDLLEIPASIEGLTVRAIGDNAFAGGAFATIVIPSGIKEIGWFAFSSCKNLKSVTLPASVEKIEYGAFENCPKYLTFLCPEDCYAAAYARSYGFAVKILD